MAHELAFTPAAQKAWDALDPATQRQAAKALAKRRDNPRVASAALTGSLAGAYKVKLVASGIRLVYVVSDDPPEICVVAVGKRDKLAAYRDASRWLERNPPPLG